MILQNDNKIVVGGNVIVDGMQGTGLARYYGDENRKQILIAKIRR